MRQSEQAVRAMVDAYREWLGQPVTIVDAYFFCDNKDDADACAELVLRGVKRATSPSLWWFEENQVPLPRVGDLNVVTRFDGEPLCIIETVKVTITPYNQISESYAETEGEGDKTLEYWRSVHWPYYQRELAATSRQACETMPIVCEEFKVVFPNQGDR